jgi:hypothetical protein
MRKYLGLYKGLTIAAFSSLTISCQKEDAEPFPQFDVIVGQHVKAGDTATYNLTIESGHRELAEVIVPPKHGSFSAISKDPSSGWYIYKYKAESGFLGVDSVVFKSNEPIEKQTLYTHWNIQVAP